MRQHLNADNILGLVNEKQVLAIGRVISQWSMLETTLNSCIWRAAKLRNDHGWIIAAQMQVPSKLDSLGAILFQDAAYSELAARFKLVADYVKECLIGKRNLVAHGLWVSAREAGDVQIVTKFAARGRLTSQGGFFTPGELEQIARDIADVTAWLLTLDDHFPKLRQRRGGLGQATPDTQTRPDCPNRKRRALQPLSEPQTKSPHKRKHRPVVS